MTPPFESLTLNSIPRFYRCEPGWRWSPPPLADYDLWYVAGGEGEMLVESKRYALVPGIAFVLPPGAEPKASQHPDRRLLVFYFHFAPSNLTDELGSQPERPLPIFGRPVRDEAWFTVMARQCARSAARNDTLADRQAMLLADLMVLHLCDESLRSDEDNRDALIWAIVNQIEESPGEDWSVNRQAGMAHLSPSHYSRRFAALTGRPPRRFVIDARLARASQLLRETDMSLTAIADGLGYRDLFFFSRQFKRHRGASPSTLRQTKIASDSVASESRPED